MNKTYFLLIFLFFISSLIPGIVLSQTVDINMNCEQIKADLNTLQKKIGDIKENEHNIYHYYGELIKSHEDKTKRNEIINKIQEIYKNDEYKINSKLSIILYKLYNEKSCDNFYEFTKIDCTQDFSSFIGELTDNTRDILLFNYDQKKEDEAKTQIKELCDDRRLSEYKYCKEFKKIEKSKLAKKSEKRKKTRREDREFYDDTTYRDNNGRLRKKMGGGDRFFQYGLIPLLAQTPQILYQDTMISNQNNLIFAQSQYVLDYQNFLAQQALTGTYNPMLLPGQFGFNPAQMNYTDPFSFPMTTNAPMTPVIQYPYGY